MARRKASTVEATSNIRDTDASDVSNNVIDEDALSEPRPADVETTTTSGVIRSFSMADNPDKVGVGGLSRYKKPRISTSSKYRSQRATKEDVKPRKSRNAGKLVKLMDLPLDVFFEITSKLQPLDILNLSRVSKYFRGTFHPKTSRHIWVAARRNIPGLPDCPPDLNEAQYACLLFEHRCHACGIARAKKFDYGIRVRFCAACFRENIQKGSRLAKSLGKFPSVIYTLLPRCISSYYAADILDSANNSRFNHYYAPELEMVVNRYRSLANDQHALNRFVKEQQILATDMMKYGQILSQWEESARSDKHARDNERATSRVDSIETKLIELGWEKKDFPPRWDTEWQTLVCQPRELTPRIWASIHPKLEVLLERTKAQKLRDELDIRIAYRRQEFGKFWDTFLNQIPSFEERILMPNRRSAQKLPSVVRMIEENEGSLEVTAERWASFFDSALLETEAYKSKVEEDLLELLKENPEDNDTLPDGATPVGLGAATGCTDLRAASTFFSCHHWPCSALLRFPALLDHGHICDVEWTTQFLRFNKEASEVARLIFQALGLPGNPSCAALDDLDGRLVCLCGDPKFSNPTTLAMLINHIVGANRWYRERRCLWRQEPTSPELSELLHHEQGSLPQPRDAYIPLFNDHDLQNLESLVALLPRGELIDSTNKTALPAAKFCLPCYLMTNSSRYESFMTDNEVTYHMKAKHHRDATEQNAVSQKALQI